MKSISFAIVFAMLLLARTSWCQSPTAPVFNTASAGVQAADVEAAVAIICPAGDIARSKTGAASGCKVCPGGTDFYHYGRSDWDMFAQTAGHFTSPQDNDLLLDGTGCDSDADSDGGTFIFTLKSGKPRLLYYDQGLITDECNKFAYTDGRDFLVCRGGGSIQGESDENVFVATFAATGKASTTKLLATTDTTGSCADPTQVVQQSQIRDTQFSTGAAGAITGIKITATLGNVKCSQANSDVKTGVLPAAVKSYVIEFLFDGKRFKVAPTSAAALNRFSDN